MNYLDWLVIFAYLAVVIFIAAIIRKSQNSIDDYYLAGKKMRWWASGLSTMATQMGAISFVSAPAFVAMKKGGGLKWLCYELSVPLGLIIVMAVIIPILHKRNYISIYEYLEKRFDNQTRLFVSVLFQIGRGLATAVSVLAGGIILSSALRIPTAYAILIIGIVTVIYDMLGGISMVILSDVLQMGIIVAGFIICSGMALSLMGWGPAWYTLTPERLEILDFSRWGFTPGGEYAFWPMVIGGFFLYASYYGCDQSQVQRQLSVKNITELRKSLLMNAFGRFPIVLLYCIMGVLVGALFLDAGHLSRMAVSLNLEPSVLIETLREDPDRMLPYFILTSLPHGIIGLIFVAIMAALMSSLDSGINSLSAVTMVDIYRRHFKPRADKKHYLFVSRLITMFWGMFCIGFALLFSSTDATRSTAIVLINAVSSMLYGPILAAFILGMLSRWAGSKAIKIGIASGVCMNISLWLLTDISWLWWNAFGFITTALTAYITSYLFPRAEGDVSIDTVEIAAESSPRWGYVYLIMAGYFFAIIALCYSIEGFI